MKTFYQSISLGLLTFALAAGTTTANAADFEIMGTHAYSGNGRWSDANGENGTYTASFACNQGTLTSTYNYGNVTRTVQLMTIGDGQHFSVYSPNSDLSGEGYCVIHHSVQQCQLWLRNSQMEIEEVYTFNPDGLLERTGSFTTHGKQVFWHEDLR
jgi:hypothetical protein